ncbi:MAG: lipopolysaccharide biosynthesis protein [Lachnospiraceae bacterium]|nr:lipopolysaccharide biosynthesis protein [Lachnospiraceae bacterium]
MEDNKNGSIKHSVISGVFWKLFERIGAQAVTFVVTIVLARILNPSDYGLISLVMIFINIANVFAESGFGSALIQKKDADEVDFSSVFYFGIAFSGLLYFILYMTAPAIGHFYNQAEIVPVLRVLALRIPLAAVNTVQKAYVSRKMVFKRFFYATLGGTIGSAVVGIVMAYQGYGIWALVAQYLFNSTIDTLVLWFTVRWRPTTHFSMERLRGLLKFGWKLLCAGLLETIYNQLRSLVIGKKYSTSDLAYYNKGDQFPSLIVTNVNTSISSVLFPAMSQYQDEREKVKTMTRRAIQISSYLICPMMMGLALVAEPLVRLILTEKWVPCVPYMQIMCFIYATWMIHTANLEAMKAVGRSDLFLRLELIKKVYGIVLLLISMRHGVMAIALSGVVNAVLSLAVNAYPNGKLLNYPYKEQIKDLLPALLLSAAMGIGVYAVGGLIEGEVYRLILQVVAGGVIYGGLSLLFQVESFRYLLGIIQAGKNKGAYLAYRNE